MKKIAIIIIAMLTAAACTSGYKPTDKTFETNSTVNVYLKFIRTVVDGKPVMPFHQIMVADINTEQLSISLSLVGEESIGSVYDVMDYPTGDKAKAFKETQQKFNDFNPTPSVFRYYQNKKGQGEWHLDSGNCIYYAFGEQISKISITSNNEWCANYPAGTDLAPLFTAEFGSLSQYIQSGYDDNSYILCRKIVSELTAADMAPLLESDWNIYGGTDISLTTTTLPQNYHDHTITISLTLDTGEVVAYTERLSDIVLW